MITPTKTPWFPASTKPMYSGAYELRGGKFAWFGAMSGKWFVPHMSPAGAMGCAGFDTPIQDREWRGVMCCHQTVTKCCEGCPHA